MTTIPRYLVRVNGHTICGSAHHSRVAMIYAKVPRTYYNYCWQMIQVRIIQLILRDNKGKCRILSETKIDPKETKQLKDPRS